jgi:steroid Delta-isomerase
VEKIRLYYRLVDSNDVEGLVELFAPDAVYQRPGYSPLTGRDELQKFYHRQRIIERGEHTLSCIVVRQPHVAIHGNFVGTLKDGRNVALRFAEFFIFGDDGLFSRRDTFFFTPLV